MSSRWNRAIAELSAQGNAARAAAQRVDDAPGNERATAKVISYAAGTDYLRSASALLRAHLTDRRPPRRLPVARVWPWFRDVWEARAGDRRGGVWRAVPRDGDLERMRSAPSSALLAAVVQQAEALQASLHGKRNMHRLHEAYIPERTGRAVTDMVGSGRSAPTLPGFPDPGHFLNRAFPQGSGTRIQPDRLEEFNQLSRDRFEVHIRARAFGDAVLALLVEDRAGGVVPQPGRLRGAGRWVGREQQLVLDRAKWPAKLNFYQGVTLAGLGWLVLACTGLPLTFGMEADLLSHALLLFMAAGLIGCAGIGLVARYGPKLVKAPGLGAAVPGIAAGLIAFVVWQGQGPVASYFFAGPYDRYEREYANSCLAASPYRRDAVQATVDDGVLVVTPISGGTTLRLGPAKDGGTHPLQPLDQATRKALDRYGC
ncbi:hypothetical protein OG605_39005 (plasmid) [Streptomyces xanthophaeus]|uniref:hypothetical protein n=1 Tax=Streptomyces xanthophaeus TaxID=67385 RepID=UPI002F90D18E|nr:hypothetical protein OG605_39005 [Streptomyces xanthophaeus]